MEKKGDFLMVFLFILLLVSIAAFLTIYYFYEVKVYEEIRICVGGQINDTKIPCQNDSECRGFLKKSGELPDFSSAPSLIKDGFDKIFEEAVFCEETCKFKSVRGYDLKTFENRGLKSCSKGEKEFLFQIRGKDALEIINYLETVS